MTNRNGICVTLLDGALCAPTIIGHWELVIGHSSGEFTGPFVNYPG